MFLSYFIEQHQFSLCASPVIQSRKGSLLLDCISVMSTVSGGTITGLKYMLALAQKQDINAMVHELFDFLYNEDLTTKSLEISSQTCMVKTTL